MCRKKSSTGAAMMVWMVKWKKKTTLNGTIFNCNNIRRIKNTLEPRFFFRYNTTPFINLKRQKKKNFWLWWCFLFARQCLSNKSREVFGNLFRPHGNWYVFSVFNSTFQHIRERLGECVIWRHPPSKSFRFDDKIFPISGRLSVQG